jgi:hypothetical protein
MLYSFKQMENFGRVYTTVVELPFYMLGLYDKPYHRFALTAGVTAGALWLIKPRGLFDEQGKPRPWAGLDNSDKATPLNWAGFSILAGFFAMEAVG